MTNDDVGGGGPKKGTNERGGGGGKNCIFAMTKLLNAPLELSMFGTNSSSFLL